MTKVRLLLGTLFFTAILVLAAMTLPSSPFLGKACADGGCGEGTNQCKYDCPGIMNCAKHSDPFKYCACSGGECTTSNCQT